MYEPATNTHTKQTQQYSVQSMKQMDAHKTTGIKIVQFHRMLYIQ